MGCGSDALWKAGLRPPSHRAWKTCGRFPTAPQPRRRRDRTHSNSAYKHPEGGPFPSIPVRPRFRLPDAAAVIVPVAAAVPAAATATAAAPAAAAVANGAVRCCSAHLQMGVGAVEKSHDADLEIGATRARDPLSGSSARGMEQAPGEGSDFVEELDGSGGLGAVDGAGTGEETKVSVDFFRGGVGDAPVVDCGHGRIDRGPQRDSREPKMRSESPGRQDTSAEPVLAERARWRCRRLRGPSSGR